MSKHERQLAKLQRGMHQTEERRLSRLFWRTFMKLFGVGICLLGVGLIALPESQKVTASDTTDWRHLDPIPSNTTTSGLKPTTTTTLRAGKDEVIIISGDNIWRIPRTPIVDRALFALGVMESS